MIWILLLTATLLLPATLALAGWAAHQRFGRQGPARPRLRQAIALHALVFCVMYGGFVFVAFDSLAAQQPAEATAVDGTCHVAVAHDAFTHLLKKLARNVLLAREVVSPNAVDVLRADTGDSVFNVADAAFRPLARF